MSSQGGDSVPREDVGEQPQDEQATMAGERAPDPAAAPGVTIAINCQLIRPESQMPGGDLYQENAARSNYILIQFTEYPTPEQEEQLRAGKIQFCKVIPPLSWLAKFEPQDLSWVRDLPFVLYANPYHESLSLNPAWEEELQESRRPHGVVGTATGSTPVPLELHDTMILLHDRSRSPEQMLEYLVSHYSIPRNRLAPELRSLYASLTADQIFRISKIDDVKSITPEPKPEPQCHLMRDITVIPDAIPNVTPSVDLDGRDELIVVVDSGFDDGIENHGPNGWFWENKDNPWFSGRVKHLDARSDDKGNTRLGLEYSRENKKDDLTGHGTHVAGIALGSYSSAEPQFDTMKLQGPEVRGVAPQAHLVMLATGGAPKYSLGSLSKSPSGAELKPIPYRQQLLYCDPYFGYPEPGSWVTTFEKFMISPDPNKPVKLREPKIKARIHNASQGTAPDAKDHGYSAVTELADVIAYKLPDYFIVKAAGNYGDDKTTSTAFPLGNISLEASAKNCIAVGACYNDQFVKVQNSKNEEKLYEEYLKPAKGGVALSSNNIPRFSSRGPTAGMPDPNGSYGQAYRDIIKPDLVAPGVAIYSAKSQGMIDELSLLAKAAPKPDQWCMFKSGTSMAAPVVSGAAALLRQALRRRGFLNPTSALLKALMINGTVDLSTTTPRGRVWKGNPVEHGGGGHLYEEDIEPAPSDAQGWGRLHITESIENVVNTTMCGFQDCNMHGGIGGRLAQDAECRHEATINAPTPDELLAKPNLRGNLKATLVWTDLPGAGLQNQLSLAITAKDKTAYPDIGAAVDVQGTGNNARLKRMAKNNVQKLIVPNIQIPPGGGCTLQIVVRAERIVPDTDKDINPPGNQTVKPPQAYAICWKVWYSDPWNHTP